MQWDLLPKKETIEKTKIALEANGFNVLYAETSEEAREKVLSLIPKGAEVMTMTSVTLDVLGLPKHINESSAYDAVRPNLMHMNRETQRREMQKLGSAPEHAIGSVHAVTQDGSVLVASNSGSQLPAYIYGSLHVIWVVGVQKIVKDLQQGMKRIYEHSLPLEAERARKAYGVSGSFVSKLLVVNKEVMPGRITIILVNQVLGF